MAAEVDISVFHTYTHTHTHTVVQLTISSLTTGIHYVFGRLFCWSVLSSKIVHIARHCVAALKLQHELNNNEGAQNIQV